MARSVAHGGQCCGMRHIHEFRNDDATNVEELLRCLGENDYSAFAQEVILSNRQTEQYPQLIEALKRTGFVYTTAFTGRHGTPVHVFHRARRRLALSAARFNWEGGMVANAGISGDLGPWQNEARAAQPHDPFRGLRRGSRVRVNSPASRRHNQEYILTRVAGEYNEYGDRVYKGYMREPNGTEFGIIVQNLVDISPGRWVQITRDTDITHLRRGDRIRYQGQETTIARVPGIREGYYTSAHALHLANWGVTYFIHCEMWVPNGEGEVAPEPERRTYRHPVLEAGAAEVPAPRRVSIITEFYALFQNGNCSGPYTSAVAVREAHPRVLRYRVREIFSDGTSEWTDSRF